MSITTLIESMSSVAVKLDCYCGRTKLRSASCRLSRSPPSAKPKRSPNAVNIVTSGQNETNPYEPVASQRVSINPPKKLTGFFRGARNGFLWSLPVFVSLTIFISNYGRNPPPLYAAMFEAFQIPAVWILISGLVAAVADRNKR